MSSTGASGTGGATTPTITGYRGYVFVDGSAAGGPDTSFRDAGFAVERVGISIAISLYMDGVLVAEQRRTNSQVTWDTVEVEAHLAFEAPPGAHTFYATVGGTVSGHWVTSFIQGAYVTVALSAPDRTPVAIKIKEVYTPPALLPTALSGTTSNGLAPTLTLTRLSDNAVVATGAVSTDGAGGWSAPITGVLTGPASYRVVASVPDTSNDAADWAATSATYDFSIGVVTISNTTNLRRALGLYVERLVGLRRLIPLLVRATSRLRRTYADPLDRVIDPGLVAAGLAPLHTFSARLWVQWDGVNWYDETSWWLSASGIDDVDITTRRLNSAEATITLDNSDLRYSASNAGGPLYSSLRRNGQAAYIEAGYNGLRMVVYRGVVNSLVPRNVDRTASLNLVARSSLWRQTNVTYGPATNVRSDNVIRALLTSAGLVEGADFVLDPGDVTLPYALATDTDLMTELNQVTAAEGGRLFFDTDGGVLRFWSRSHTRRVQSQPIVVLSSREHLYDLARSTTPQGLATEVTLEYEDRAGTGSETVYQQGRPIALPAAYQFGGTWYPSPPVRMRLSAMDYIRFERYFPVLVSGIASILANSSADGTGAALAVTNALPPASAGAAENTVYYQAQFDVGFAVVTFWNMSAAAAYITTLTMTGTPQRPSAPWAVSAIDEDAKFLYGYIPVTLRNAYLPTTDLAMELARETLAYRSEPLNRVDIPLQDGLPFLRVFDVLRIVDETAGTTLTYDVQVLRNEWSMDPASGYTQRLQTGPSFPAQYMGPASIAPTPAAVWAQTVESSPWYYGAGSSHDGTFGFVEFA